jgi:WD40 repeat protein
VAAAALAARVIEVIADLGPLADSRYRYGSGCIVGGGTVLTAAHVVAGAISVMVRDPDRREYAARVDPRFVGDPDGPGPDLALLEITDPVFEGDLPPVGLAAVGRDSPSAEPVERCHAVGYPWFAESASPTAMRDTVDAVGIVPVMSKLKTGLLSVQVTVTPRELPPEETTLEASQWSGMSGAPVFAAGRLLGVVTAHAPREGPSAIMAVPLTAVQAEPGREGWGPGVADPAAWWSRLGVTGIGDLQRLPLLPPPRPLPAYRWTLREIGWTLHERMPQLLGRERELTQIASFAVGREGYRRLEGGAYTGKTALVYEAVTVGLPDEVDVVCYFLSRRASDASSGRFLAAVVPQLAYLCDVDAPEANLDQYYKLWEQATAQAAQTGRHLLLAVDGLDEDLRPPGSPSVARLLPTQVGPHAHVLVTSRPRPDLPEDVPHGHPLTRLTPVQLDPFTVAQELADLAKAEIYNLTHGDNSDLAVDVLGLLTAAQGPLSLRDLVALQSDELDTSSVAGTRHIRRVVEERAARSLERVGPAGQERYEFAHALLLEYAQTVPDLCDPAYRQRIHRWASRWRDAGWPTTGSREEGAPRYLLNTYPATLAHEPQQLAQLVSDIGWAEAAIASAGVDWVLDDLRQAAAANPASTRIAAVAAAITGQSYDLRPPQPVGQPGYILRQLWMQAAELGEDDLAEDIRSCLQSRAGPGLVPQWTTRRASRALSGELGRHSGRVAEVAVLADGRIVTGGGGDGRVLIWDPAHPGADPVELGRHDNGKVSEVAVLADGRVATSGGYDNRVLVWDPAHPGAAPLELRLPSVAVWRMVALADGRVVISGEENGRVLIANPARPGDPPVELGRRFGWVYAMAGLADGRVVASAGWTWVLIWDPVNLGTGPVALGRHDGGQVIAIAELADGRVATSGGYDNRVLVWDPAHPGTAPLELCLSGNSAWKLAALADGRVIIGGTDGQVLIWDPARPGAAPVELGRHDRTVHAVAVLADGHVVTGGADGRVLLWDPAGPATAPAEAGYQGPDQADAVAVLADGHVVTGGADGRVLLWDPAGPATAPAELGYQGPGRVTAVAVLPDQRIAAVSEYDRRVLIWDPAHPGADPVKMGRHDRKVLAVAVTDDGRVVTGCDDGRVLIWDPAQPGTALVELSRRSRPVYAVAVLPDGRVVTGCDDGQVLIWDPARAEAAPVKLGNQGPGQVTAVAVLPDGRVVTGGWDRRVLIWDPTRPQATPAELGRHHGLVYGVAVLADGRVVTCGKDDRRVLIWEPARTSTKIMQLSCSPGTLGTAPSGPVTSTLAIADLSGGLSLWTITA